jgi:hypothetical protein
MTLRDAVIQAYVELGMSREMAELKAKAANAFMPDAAALTQSPVKPGQEREFIEAMKQIFRKMEANPKAVQDALRDGMEKRTKAN